MGFVKGAMIGIIAGTVIGAMNSDSLSHAVHMGKRQVRKMKRRYRF